MGDAKLSEKWVEVNGYRVLPGTSLTCVLHLRRIQVMPERAMMDDGERCSEIPDQEHFRMCLGQFPTIGLGVVEVDRERGSGDETPSQNYFFYFKDAAGGFAIPEPLLVAWSMEEAG